MVAGYLIVQVSNNSAGAAYNAVVPDVVPEEEFGKASGVVGSMVQLGSAFGLGAIVAIALVLKQSPLLDYLVIAAVITLTMIPTLLVTRGEGLGEIVTPPSRPFREEVADFLRPLHSGDFAWVIATRTFITAGIYTLLPFLQYFFVDVVKVGEQNAVSFTGTWQLVLLLVATPFGLLGGWLSDRYGRKKFVYASGALQGLVLLVFVVLYPTSPILVIALGALYGVGYGLYYAVDWALACDTLPDKSRSAKDMGLFHVSFTLPQVLLPALMGPLLDYFNHQTPNSGYRIVFSFAIVFFVMGTILVSRIKSVR
jgi:MFS family permease